MNQPKEWGYKSAYESSSEQEPTSLQRVIRAAQHTTGSELPSMQDLYSQRSSPGERDWEGRERGEGVGGEGGRCRSRRIFRLRAARTACVSSSSLQEPCGASHRATCPLISSFRARCRFLQLSRDLRGRADGDLWGIRSAQSCELGGKVLDFDEPAAAERISPSICCCCRTPPRTVTRLGARQLHRESLRSENTTRSAA
ncbi:hypothetical protein Q8A73_023265 [Channa argus]|nr:hypothetical protein Q8A73_023265 [Channa argus]